MTGRHHAPDGAAATRRWRPRGHHRAGGGSIVWTARSEPQFDVKGRGDSDHGVHVRGLVTLLDPVDGLPFEPSHPGELLLGNPPLAAQLSDAVAEDPAVGKDPVGRGSGWHPTTLTGS
ncbi:hypothetical protein [Streptomyces sp. SID13726]|uniref:hypothetical protein n=1 Tax=Streptomyces sp. SID13726 TaxID=2706058 RepID=UPI001EF3472E|nr:hypothetical protein [Streptomyces sp. SID13726]